MMKTIQDNNMVNRTTTFYAKIDIDLMKTRSGVVYDENQTGQRREW